MAPTILSFPRTARLLSPEQYSAALKTRPFARSDWFTCHRCDNVEPDAAQRALPKLGFVIPKRLVKLSVRRNSIKRVLREAFRHCQASLPAGYYVFRLKAPVPASSLTELKRAVREQADNVLAKAGKRS